MMVVIRGDGKLHGLGTHFTLMRLFLNELEVLINMIYDMFGKYTRENDALHCKTCMVKCNELNLLSICDWC